MMHCELSDFLSDFHISDAKLTELSKRFLLEIKKGLRKDTNANADTKCFITYVQDLPTGQEVGKYLALDLGGTNFRVLLVTLEGNGEAKLDSKIFSVPEDIKTGTGIQLFDHIASCLAEFTDEQKIGIETLPLGFTFSFPCVQLGLDSATLVRWTKGFNVEGVVGQDVVLMLKEAIERQGRVKIEVVALLNDTTGTLLSCAHRNPSCRVGVIVGTGSNACYVEKVENAEMLPDEYKTEKTHVIINIEWGAFGERGALDDVRNQYDRAIDEKSINVGTQLFEKMLSGMYLGEMVRLVLIRAIPRNLIFKTSKKKDALVEHLEKQLLNEFDTSLISEIESDSGPEFAAIKKILKDTLQLDVFTAEDCEKLQMICRRVSHRSARLVAMAISVLINKMGEPDVVVGVDGSVYQHHPKYKGHLMKVMRRLVDPRINFDVMLSQDGSGRGAALVAAVTSQKKSPK